MGEAILISRRIWCRVRSFLTYRIAATLQLLSFFFVAVFAYRPVESMPKDWKEDPEFTDTQVWPAFFHMPVLMLMLITLLNDGTLITIGYDLAVAPKTPPIWNMPFLFSMAFVQSFVAMISSVQLLHILLCPCRWRLVLHGETRRNFDVWCNDCVVLLHVLRHVLAEILPRRYPDRRSLHERTQNVGGFCVGLVSELVARRGRCQGFLQVDRAQVQHLRHQQQWYDGDDRLGVEAPGSDA